MCTAMYLIDSKQYAYLYMVRSKSFAPLGSNKPTELN